MLIRNIFVVTGGTSSIGFDTARYLTREGEGKPRWVQSRKSCERLMTTVIAT